MILTFQLNLNIQGRNAARSEPPPPGRRGDQYDAPRQQSEYVPPRRGARSPPRQDYSPRQEEREGFTERLHKRYEDERRQDYQNHVQQVSEQSLREVRFIGSLCPYKDNCGLPKLYKALVGFTNKRNLSIPSEAISK